jgi:uncharacterized membrane protein
VGNKVKFYFNRLGERLWVKPMVMCLLSLAGIWLANFADAQALDDIVPEISVESVVSLLKILSSGMLVIATLAVTSMVAAYGSASTTATPRAFPLVVADDHSQFALSTFVGAFIFSVVTLVVVQNHYYGKAGLFAIFVITLFVLTAVILTFVRWMDCIARLGLLGNTIKKIEDATRCALDKRRQNPTMGGLTVPTSISGTPVCTDQIGYVQLIDMEALQSAAEKFDGKIIIESLPGAFVTAETVLARFATDNGAYGTEDCLAALAKCFVIGRNRTFDEDPRFGLVTLSQVASRALSPAINDPGTAIDIIAAYVRLLSQWAESRASTEKPPTQYDRVAVPQLDPNDLFDDAFAAIGRDGAAMVEVAIRLQKGLAALAAEGGKMEEAALRHAELAMARAERALSLSDDIKAVKACCPAETT